MLKHPDRFLPVTTGSGLHALVCASCNGDFQIKLGEDFYINPFHNGHRFFRVTVSEIFMGPLEIEEASDRELLRSLIEVKNSYMDLYFS